MLILVNKIPTGSKNSSISNSPKLTLLMLSVLTLISIIFGLKVDITSNAPTYFLLGVMLFPMSHLFNSYNAILQVRTIEGLKTSEIKRLNHTIQVRSKNIVKVMMVYVAFISITAVFGVTGAITQPQSLLISLSIIFSALVDTKFAWDTLAEIRDLEQKLLLRQRRIDAHAKMLEQSNL